MNTNLIVAGSDAGVFISQDGGATWATLGDGLPNAAVNKVFFSGDGYALYVATHGRGMWVLAFPHVKVTPSSVSLYTMPGVNPPDQTLTLQNAGFGQLNWHQTATLPPWLSLIDTSLDQLAPFASQTLTLSFHLPPSSGTQTYTTTLSFEPWLIGSNNPGDKPTLVPVTVHVSPISTQWYFAEGWTGGDFAEFFSLANPDPTATAHVAVRYLLAGGQVVTKTYPVGPAGRATVNVGDPAIGIGPNQSNAMTVTSDLPIVAERALYGTMQLPGLTVPSGTTTLGATHLGQDFALPYVDSNPGHRSFITILNDNPTPMTVTATYFPYGGGAPITTTNGVAATARGTLDVSNQPNLPAGPYSVVLHLDQPGVVERALYEKDWITGYTGMTDVPATPVAPAAGRGLGAASWSFADGYTSGGPDYVSERYVLANLCPTAGCAGVATAEVGVTFLDAAGGQHPQQVALAPGQVRVLDVGALYGPGFSNAAVVTAVDAANPAQPAPILAERFASFSFPGIGPGAAESGGTAQLGQYFAFADGWTGAGFADYLSVLNPDASRAATLTLTFLKADGSTQVATWAVAAHSRGTLDLKALLGPNTSYALTVVADRPVAAERALYFAWAGRDTGGSAVAGYQGEP